MPAKTPLPLWVLQKPAMGTAHRGPGSRQRAGRIQAKQSSDNHYDTDNSHFDIYHSGSSNNPCSPVLGVEGPASEG